MKGKAPVAGNTNAKDHFEFDGVFLEAELYCYLCTKWDGRNPVPSVQLGITNFKDCCGYFNDGLLIDRCGHLSNLCLLEVSNNVEVCSIPDFAITLKRRTICDL